MYFPSSRPAHTISDAYARTPAASPRFVQEDVLRSYGSMPEFTRYALIRSTQHSLGYQPEQLPMDAAVRLKDVRPLRQPQSTFSERIEKAALELTAQESTAAGRQFVQDVLQACRERGEPLDSVAMAVARRTRTVGDFEAGIHGPAAERSSAFVDTLLASVRQNGRVLPLGHPDFHRTLAACQPHMRRTLEKLAACGVVPAALEWQLADYTNRLVRVSQICDRNQLAGADDFCRLFIEPEPNATVARQRRDWDQRLAELAPATSAQWQARRRAAALLAPMLNPQVAQHLQAALNTAGT